MKISENYNEEYTDWTGPQGLSVKPKNGLNG